MSHEAHDLEFDETISGNRRPANLLSTPRSSKFYHSTTRAIDYETVTRSDGAEHALFPSVLLENAFKDARVKGITAAQGYREMKVPTKCLSIEWLRKALALLLDNGLLHDEDTGELITFATYDEFMTRARKLVQELQDREELEVNPEDLEWLEDVAAGQNRTDEEKQMSWILDLTIHDMVAKTENLSLWIELRLMLGHHSTEEHRRNPESTFYLVAGGPGGGQLGGSRTVNMRMCT